MKTNYIENNLREYRKKNNYTQKQVANCLGLKSEDQISIWENGHGVPGLVNLLKRLAALEGKKRSSFKNHTYIT